MVDRGTRARTAVSRASFEVCSGDGVSTRFPAGAPFLCAAGKVLRGTLRVTFALCALRTAEAVRTRSCGVILRPNSVAARLDVCAWVVVDATLNKVVVARRTRAARAHRRTHDKATERVNAVAPCSCVKVPETLFAAV